MYAIFICSINICKAYLCVHACDYIHDRHVEDFFFFPSVLLI